MNNVKNAVEHLKKHQKYPASRNQLIEECDDLSDFSNEDKEWFRNNLPEGTYETAEEVMMVLGLQDSQKMGKSATL